MEKNMSVLYAFIESAVKSRKYPESTANGLRAALKLFDAELSAEERGSISLFMERFDQIYASVCSKNQLKFSAASLATYKSRVIKVMTDYQKYGVDPTKMASWSPKVVSRAKRASSKDAEVETAVVSHVPRPYVDVAAVATTSLVKDFGEGRVAQIILPTDISDEERKKLSALIENM
jgi:hypothetical protein